MKISTKGKYPQIILLKKLSIKLMRVQKIKKIFDL
jgi:hypothetical protein